MASEDIVDSLVDDAALGIRKKPSVFKFAFVIFVAAISVFMAYSIYMKSKAEDKKPDLVLGPSLNNPPVEQIKTSAGDVTHPESQPAQVVTPVQPIVTAAQPIAATVPPQNIAPAPIVVAAAQTSQSNVVDKTQLPSASTTNNLVEAAPVQQNVEEKKKLIAVKSKVESDVKEALVQEPMVKTFHKKVVKKSVKKEVSTETVQTPAIPMEEGVTREEIIVIQ